MDGSQTFAEIEAGLAMAMRHEYDDMKANWVEFNGDSDEEINAWLNTTFDGDYRDDVNRLKNMTLDPIFTSGDDRYFDVINRSTHANYHIDLTKLYDNYYTVEMVNGDRTNVNIQLPDDNTNTEEITVAPTTMVAPIMAGLTTVAIRQLFPAQPTIIPTMMIYLVNYQMTNSSMKQKQMKQLKINSNSFC